MADAPSHAQIRGARAMLDWSLADLAKAAHISVASVHRAENDRLDPGSDEAARLIRQALEAEGVRFTPDDGFGPGVCLSSKDRRESGPRSE